MSAFLVNQTHIDAMLTAGLMLDKTHGPLRWWYPAVDATRDFSEQEIDRRELTTETAGRVGAMLLAENQRSVNYRYSEDELEFPYEFEMLPGTPDPLVTLKAIACYEYQSCEHEGWKISEAFQFCEALRHRAINCLPGYRDADGWEITDRNIWRTPTIQEARSRRRYP